MPNNNVSSWYLTPEEVAQILRIHVMTVYQYIHRDNLKAVRLGRNYRISRQDLDDFITSKRTSYQEIGDNLGQKISSSSSINT